MPVPTPEELQMMMGIHPDQVAANQALANAANGGAQPGTADVPPPDQMPPQPRPQPAGQPQPAPAAARSLIASPAGPRALNVPKVGESQEEKPEPLPVFLSSPRAAEPLTMVPPVGSPGPVPGSVVSGVDAKGRPTLSPDQYHQTDTEDAGSPFPMPRALGVPPVGTAAPDETTTHDLMTKPMQMASMQTPTPAAQPGRDPADAAREARDRAKLDQDRANGSGVDRFRQRHRILGGLVKGLDIAGSIVSPGALAMVPGSTLHHQVQLNQDRSTLNSDLQDESRRAQTAHLQAETEGLNNKPDASPKPVFDHAGDLIGFQADGNILGPNSPKLTQDMRDMVAAAKGKTAAAGTPEAQAMGDLKTQVNPATGKKYTAYEAWQKINQDKAENKPDTAVQHRQQYEGIVQKAIAAADGSYDPGVATDIKQFGSFLKNSKGISNQEKEFALSYLSTNGSPAATGTGAQQRGQSYSQAREYSVLDTKNGNRPVYISADELNRAQAQEPGRYLSSGAGTTALNKENLMEDIRGGIQQVRDALNNPNMPDFTAKQKVKIAIAMRERDPHSAVSSLITNGDLGTMTGEQEDYLIAHSILAEQAMAMRTVLGAGQGSQDLRAAITATFPGPTTPSKRYGLKQLDAFEKTVDRLERGIPDVPLKPQRNGGGSNTPPPAPKGMISVQIPGHPVGHIPASARKQFLQDNPGAQVIE